MTSKNLSRKNNFTLIELLVVIGIIGILIGILLPAISAALKEGKKTKAEATCRLIAQAVAAYKNDYQTIPAADENMVVSAAVYSLLNGASGRKKVYYENNGTVKDPWGGQFYISFDEDYDGTSDVNLTVDGTAVVATVAGPVAVWSYVPGGSYVSSWE